jgi:hypothetical protein
MAYYRDVAEHGLLGNPGLVAPFAFRPAAPLIIGAVSRLTGWTIEETFRAGCRLMGVLLIAGCYLLARHFGARQWNALWIAVVLPLNATYIKWPLFAVSMVDVYAYPIFLLAFYLLWEGRYWTCAALTAPGLFFKEFLLVPLLTVAGVWTYSRRGQWRRIAGPLAAVGAILFVCFILPRVLIHVVDSFQDIDPAHPKTLMRLIQYPRSWRRWFNIFFAYVAIWLPVLMLLNGSRLKVLFQRLRPRALLLLVFLWLHLLLVVYGGTNLLVFVSYSLPVAILVLHYLVEDGRPHALELILIIAAVIVFNRLVYPIPLPDDGLERYLDYYGGYHHLVTARSLFRFGEALAYIGSAMLLRRLLAAMGRLRLSPAHVARAAR